MECLRDELLRIVFNGNRINSALLHNVTNKKNNCLDHLLPQLEAAYPNIQLKEQIFLCINNLKSPPTCKFCQKPLVFQGFFKKYGIYCGNKCQTSDPKRIEKINATKKTHFGEDYIKIISEKINKTNQEKYGVDYPLQCSKIHEKTIETQMDSGGFGFQNPNTRELSQKNLVEHYGKASGNAFVHHDIDQLVTKEFLEMYHYTKKWSLTYIAQYFGTTVTFLSSRMKLYGLDVLLFHSSSLELIIHDFLKDNGIEFVTNSRNIIGLELDIFIPSHNLAIECNGLWYHSERNGYPNNRHNIKTMSCNKIGIHLLHFFESDYEQLPKLFNILRTFLGLNNKIHARKCVIKEVHKDIEREFLNRNHIQGYIPSTKCYGLYFKNELVQLISFGKSRFNKNYEWELLRLCCNSKVTVNGGASKILSYFKIVHNPWSIISYCDRRLFQGNVYTNIGFSLSHISKPNYWYFAQGSKRLLSRVLFQKHKLKQKLSNFDTSLSEWQNMVNNNYNRIWDCGNMVFIWNKTF